MRMRIYLRPLESLIDEGQRADDRRLRRLPEGGGDDHQPHEEGGEHGVIAGHLCGGMWM